MKQTINVGAYGWLQPHWENSFYPEDLPSDWRLGYYSNEFNAVLVPAYYWQQQHMADCESLLDDVHPEFQFFIEYDEQIFDTHTMEELGEALKLLKPQLSGLVFLGGLQDKKSPDERFYTLAGLLEIDMISDWSAASKPATVSETIWSPDAATRAGRRADQQAARFAIIDDDLRDLRAVRARIDPFLSQLREGGPAEAVATMIVRHPQLQAADLAKLRVVLEIMGH